MSLLEEIIFLTAREEDSELLCLINFLRSDYIDELVPIIIIFEREEHLRSRFDVEWLNRYVDYDFFLLFRFTRETFNKLLTSVMCPALTVTFRGQTPVTPDEALLMTLWWLGHGEVLNSVADKFNVVPSTVFEYSEIIIGRLCELKNQFIQWPNANEVAIVQQQFESICGFPGVIGAVDGCNINFKAPTEQQESYIDKNGNHSIKLQAVATATKIFTNINVGFGGSVHDARVFRNSRIYLEVEENGSAGNYFPNEDFHILGDKAYPLLPWIITPYKDHGNLQQRQCRFNTFHSRTRIKIEHTFGIIKQRFRILYYVNVNSPTKAIKIIVACCVLHNFCYQNSDEWEEDVQVAEDNNDDGGHYDNQNNIAIAKRDNISLLF